jgi:hypothetical protein
MMTSALVNLLLNMNQQSNMNEEDILKKVKTGGELDRLTGRRLRTVTTAPTGIPKTFGDQFVLYVDDIDTPTVRRLYVYIADGVNAWKYLDLDAATANLISGQSTGMTIYHGAMNSDGTAGNPFPSGWTSSRTSEGVYVITHNFGDSDGYTVQATIDDNTQANRVVIERDSNSFDIEVTDETNAVDDAGVNFMVIRQE